MRVGGRNVPPGAIPRWLSVQRPTKIFLSGRHLQFECATYSTGQLESAYWNDATMVRKLKHHEQKLLRKVDFTTYKSDNDHRDKLVVRRYMIQKPEDYHKYNRICGVSLHLLTLPGVIPNVSVVITPTSPPPLPPTTRQRRPPETRRTPPQQALRHGRAILKIQAQRRREQRHSQRLRPAPSPRRHDEVTDGGDGAGGDQDDRAGTRAGRYRDGYGPGVSRDADDGGLCDVECGKQD